VEAGGGIVELDSLKSLVERCTAASARRPVALCVGSGLSLPYPSLLPSAAEILTATASAFAPAARDADDAAALHGEIASIGEGLPEAYYEMLLDTVGSRVVDIWQAVDLWRRDRRLAGLSLGPNAAHYAAVLVAARGEVPIVTPNYDILLEEAARRLGLAPSTGAPAAGSVAIWKLHGSVDRLESIRTTLRTITVADWDLLDRVRQVFERPGTTVCMIGYSGRDLDFFPHVASWRLDEPFWLDRSFAWEHHAIHRRPQAFRAVEASAAEWGDHVARELHGHDLEPWGLADAEADRQAEAARRCEELVRAHAGSVARSIPGLDEARRRLVHALALHATGHDRAARRNVAMLLADPAALATLGPRLHARAHLLASDVCHEFSRYVDSVDHARAAAEAARDGDGRPDAPTLVEARLHVDGGLILQSFASLPRRRRQIVAPRAWRVVTRCLLTSIVLPLRHGWLRRGLSGSFPDDPEGAGAIRASFGYLEHLIRTAGIAQGVVQAWGAFALPALRPWWRWLGRRCAAAGYAYGLANARKYHARIGDPAGGPGEPSGRDLFLMFAYPTGQALSLRDRGEALRVRALRATGPARARLSAEALASFEQALSIASEAGNAAVALHAMVGIARVSGRRFGADDVGELLDAIQSPVYAQERDYLVDLLTGPTVGTEAA
jgi:hypothetical protein